MGTYALKEHSETRELVKMVHGLDEPVVVFDGDDECLVAMRPAVFERILFDSDLLNSAQRESFHL